MKFCDETKPFIFISYSHKDTERVVEIINRLKAEGYNVWYDEGIDPGTEWDENIASHVLKCDYFIAFISEGYIGSKNCKDELNYSRDLDKNQLLVYLEEVELPVGMAMRMNRIQSVFWYKYQEAEVELAYEKLFSAKGIETTKVYEKESITENGAAEVKAESPVDNVTVSPVIAQPLVAPSAETIIKRAIIETQDGEFNKAKELFEQAMMIEPDSAEIYIGRLLLNREKPMRGVKELCDSVLKEQGEVVKEQITVCDIEEHKDSMVKQYTVPGFLSEEDILELYKFDTGFDSEAKSLKAISEQVEKELLENNNFKRAKNFAATDNEYICYIENFVANLKKKADESCAEVQKKQDSIKQECDEFIKVADAKVLALYEEAKVKKEKADKEEAQRLADEERARKEQEERERIAAEKRKEQEEKERAEREKKQREEKFLGIKRDVERIAITSGRVQPETAVLNELIETRDELMRLKHDLASFNDYEELSQLVIEIDRISMDYSAYIAKAEEIAKEAQEKAAKEKKKKKKKILIIVGAVCAIGIIGLIIDETTKGTDKSGSRDLSQLEIQNPTFDLNFGGLPGNSSVVEETEIQVTENTPSEPKEETKPAKDEMDTQTAETKDDKGVHKVTRVLSPLSETSSSKDSSVWVQLDNGMVADVNLEGEVKYTASMKFQNPIAMEMYWFKILFEKKGNSAEEGLIVLERNGDELLSDKNGVFRGIVYAEKDGRYVIYEKNSKFYLLNLTGESIPFADDVSSADFGFGICSGYIIGGDSSNNIPYRFIVNDALYEISDNKVERLLIFPNMQKPILFHGINDGYANYRDPDFATISDMLATTVNPAANHFFTRAVFVHQVLSTDYLATASAEDIKETLLEKSSAKDTIFPYSYGDHIGHEYFYDSKEHTIVWYDGTKTGSVILTDIPNEGYMLATNNKVLLVRNSIFGGCTYTVIDYNGNTLASGSLDFEVKSKYQISSFVAGFDQTNLGSLEKVSCFAIIDRDNYRNGIAIQDDGTVVSFDNMNDFKGKIDSFKFEDADYKSVVYGENFIYNESEGTLIDFSGKNILETVTIE